MFSASFAIIFCSSLLLWQCCTCRPGPEHHEADIYLKILNQKIPTYQKLTCETMVNELFNQKNISFLNLVRSWNP